MNKIYLKTGKLGKIAGFTVIAILSLLYFSTDSIAQPACNGIPQSGNTFAPQNPVCPGAMFTVMLVGTPPQSGLTYQWLSSPDGINVVPIQGANAPQLLTSEIQPTYYNCVVTCTNSGQSSISVPVLVNLTQPVIQYPPAAVQLNNGESTDPSNTGSVTFSTPCCTGSVTYSDAVTTDCCHQVIIRTWSIVDCFSYVTTYVQTITVVLDASAPVISCSPLAPGACNTTPTPDAGTVTVIDDCPGTLTVSSSDAPGTLPCELVTTFIWTATDQCGHSSTCTQTYSRIMDTEAPVITCPGPSTLPCNSMPTPSPALITATDNCGTPEIGLLSTSTSTAGCLVTYTFTWRAIDACGNFADCDQIVNVVSDLVPPVITCPAPDTLPCNVVPSPSASLISATDNCGTPSISLIGTSSSTVDCITTNTYTWRATDACGNFADCDQIIYSISDLTPPVITCPAEVTLQCNSIPTPSVSVITAADNCGTPTITLNDSHVFTVNCLTTYVYEWKATDACGNFSICTQIINTTLDVLPPAIACPSPDTLPCNVTPSPSASLILAFDNCGTPAISLVGTSASTVDCITTTTFTWRATDDCGNFAECDQIIYSILDNTPPVITCPAEATLPCNTLPTPSASSITATDNCGIPVVTLNDTYTSTVNCITTYIYEWKATDACGNSSLCTQIIYTTADVLPPVISCPSPDTLPCNTVPIPDAADILAFDNCGPPVVTLTGTDISTVDCFTTYTFTWRATDECGHFVECDQILYSVSDIDPPVINCPQPDTLCNVTPTPNITQITAADNCGIPTVVLLGTSSQTIGCKTKHIFTWKATDQCGNISTCDQIIFVVNDLDFPVIHDCPNTMSIPTELGICGAHVSWTEPTADDNCGLRAFYSDYVSGGFYPVGTTTVTYTAIDSCGNTTTCQFDINVFDWEPPLDLSCPGVIIQDNDAFACSAFVTFNPTATDNCAVASIVSVPPSGTDFPVGVTPVTVTATDIHGNQFTCNFNVHVNDVEKPIFTNCVGTVNLNTGPGLCSANYILFAPNAVDNCAIESVVQTTPFFMNYPVGTTNVKFKATDIHGNFEICSTDVIVTDIELPVIHNCPANIVVDNDPTLCHADVSWVEPTATDNCGIFSFTSTHSPGDHFPIGITTVTYTAIDNNGNVEFCTFTVKVNDIEDPFILSHDITTCDSIVNFNFVIGDNCLIDTYSYSPPSGSVFHPGTTSVYVEAWDIHGNFSFKYFDVTVLTPTSEIDTVVPAHSQICFGDSIKLYVYMDTVGTDGSIRVYKNSCNTSVNGNSKKEANNLWSISILPDDSGVVTYYVRVEGPCDTTDCFPVSFSVVTCQPRVTLHLNVFIEGYYQGGGLMAAAVDPVNYPLLSDTAIIELHDPALPNSLSYQVTGVFDIHGTGDFDFPIGIDGNSYYIVFRHRNSMETWSALPVLFTGPVTYYSFTDALSKAYGSNLSNLGDGNFAVFSGDISDAGSAMVGIQDGIVESQDYADMENAVALTLIGYLPQDITGDGVAESADYSLMENNVYYTIYVIRP